jgi:non-ribosomal peptide synthetase-like protein
VSHTSVGARNFLGNEIHYPPGGRTGDNCLLATKVMVPTSGVVREGVGLLGSPPFEIPRSVRRDSQFDDLRTGAQLRERLARKNRVNLVTIGLYLLSRWIYVYACISIAVAIVGVQAGTEHLQVAAAGVALMLFTITYFILLERVSLGFRRLSPQCCSIYDRYYWGHERYWKLNDASYLAALNGTPFRGSLWRALGARIGRRLFDDGCAMPEKTLVEIGDDCTLGDHTTLQCHSLEDGTFKSDRIVIGSNCTIGTNAFVHYGVVMADGVVVAPDSFLMKGERPRAGSVWAGNPARLLQG